MNYQSKFATTSRRWGLLLAALFALGVGRTLYAADRPDWLREGAVISSRWYALATTQIYHEDPQGNIVDPNTGRVPWSGEPMSESLRNLRALHFTGQAHSLGMPARPTPFTLDADVLTRGERCLEVEESLSLQGLLPTKSKAVFGNCQYGGLWAGPASLAKLTKGEVLDEDPVTRIKTVVAEVNNGTVVIARVSAGGDMRDAYDKTSGLLVASSVRNVIAKSLWVMKLSRTE